MFEEGVGHVEKTWDHVLHGHSTAGENLEFAGEAIAAVAATAVLALFGLSRCLGAADAVLPKLALASDRAAAELSVAGRDIAQLLPKRMTPWVSVSGEVGESSSLRGPIQRELGIGPREREFKVVKGDVRQLLNKLKSDDPMASGKLLLQEYQKDGSLGPELKTWVQHYAGVDGGVAVNTEMAQKADMLITCYPELFGEVHTEPALKQMLLNKHVFPWAKGEIRLSEGIFANANAVDTTLIARGTDTGW